jgi:calcium-dependent protein kinase
MIASLMDESTLAEARKAFIELDTDHDGMLSIRELKRHVEQDLNRFNMRDDYLRAILRYDVSGERYTDFTYTEFLAATLDRTRCCKEDACWAAFVVLDTDGDGLISKDELSKYEILGTLTKDELQEIVELFDNNCDGYLDFAEFQKMMRDNEGWNALPSKSLGWSPPQSPREKSSVSPWSDQPSHAHLTKIMPALRRSSSNPSSNSDTNGPKSSGRASSRKLNRTETDKSDLSDPKPKVSASRTVSRERAPSRKVSRTVSRTASKNSNFDTAEPKPAPAVKATPKRLRRTSITSS